MPFIPQGNSVGTAAEIEANSRALRIVNRPDDIRDNGSYRRAMVSGTMAANLAANSGVFGVNNNSPVVAMKIRRLTISAGNSGTAFAAGVCTFALFIRRASLSAGTASLATESFHNAKLKTSMSSSKYNLVRASASATIFSFMTISSTGSAGSLGTSADADPIAAITASVIGNAGEQMVKAALIERPAESPLILTEYETLLVVATVPATGTWKLSAQIDWEESPAYS